MKKWLVILSIVLLFVIWQSVQLYLTIQSDKVQGQDAIIQFVTSEYPDLTILQTERFHGGQRYEVLTVQDSEGEYEYLFVNKDLEVTRIPFHEIQMSKEDILEIAQSEQDIVEVLRVSPAYTGRYAWEIVTKNSERQLQYLYYSMRDGEYQRRYTLTK